MKIKKLNYLPSTVLLLSLFLLLLIYFIKVYNFTYLFICSEEERWKSKKRKIKKIVFFLKLYKILCFDLKFCWAKKLVQNLDKEESNFFKTLNSLLLLYFSILKGSNIWLHLHLHSKMASSSKESLYPIKTTVLYKRKKKRIWKYGRISMSIKFGFMNIMIFYVTLKEKKNIINVNILII